MGKKIYTVKEVIADLKSAFPGISGIKDASEWGSYEEGTAIHLGNAAEGGLIDGIQACNYWLVGDDDDYVLSVHKKLASLLNQWGFFGECYDPGTYLAFRI